MPEPQAEEHLLGGSAAKLLAWATQHLNLTIKTVSRPKDTSGFVVLPRRWMVERSLAWMMYARRHARDYERPVQHSETLITWAAITLMTRRLTRGRRPRPTTPGRPTCCRFRYPAFHFFTEVAIVLSAKSVFEEILGNDESFRLFCSAASREAQGGWENGRIAALVPDSQRALAPKITRHGADEDKHGRIFNALLRKRGLEPVEVPARGGLHHAAGGP